MHNQIDSFSGEGCLYGCWKTTNKNKTKRTLLFWKENNLSSCWTTCRILAEFFSSIIGNNKSCIIGIATRSPLRRVTYEVSNPS